MAYKAIRFRATLREMAGGFPVAHKVYLVAAFLFSAFNLHALLSSDTLAYKNWLDVSQPFTDWVANFVPAVEAATAFLEKRRMLLEQHDALYWIPTVRNVLSIDFAMSLFFPLSFATAISIDLLINPNRGFKNFRAACRKLPYPVDNVILRLSCFPFLLIPMYFGFAVEPHLSSLSATIVQYFLLFGSLGLIVFVDIYLAIPLAISKLGLCAEHQGGSVLD